MAEYFNFVISCFQMSVSPSKITLYLRIYLRKKWHQYKNKIKGETTSRQKHAIQRWNNEITHDEKTNEPMPVKLESKYTVILYHLVIASLSVLTFGPSKTSYSAVNPFDYWFYIQIWVWKKCFPNDVKTKLHLCSLYINE